MSIDERLRSALDNFVDSYDYASDTGSSYSYEPAIAEIKKVIAEEYVPKMKSYDHDVDKYYLG